jgi:hypothetical protein
MNEMLTLQIKSLLGQLEEMLARLTDEQYSRPIALLSNASIGQHTRHIIEFFVELFLGYDTGTVNYDRRKRDLRIEKSRNYARQIIQAVAVFLDYNDKTLLLEGDFGEGGVAVTTNFHRELVYNMEHTVHHMALLRIGVNAVSTMTLPDHFGVALSTLNYRKACVQ